MALPLDTHLRIGIQTIHRRTEPATAPWRPTVDEARIREFRDAGVRHVVIDLVGPHEERPRQIEAFAEKVLPLLPDLRG